MPCLTSDGVLLLKILHEALIPPGDCFYEDTQCKNRSGPPEIFLKQAFPKKLRIHINTPAMESLFKVASLQL